MAREHQPIQIGLPPESAWRVAEPTPITLIAFVAGDELPDPGDAFLAAGRAFGTEPASVEPMPVDEPSIPWAFSFEVEGRGSRILLWCEHAQPGQSPDDRAPDARYLIVLQTILEPSTPDDARRAAAVGGSVWPASLADLVRLAATAATAVGADRVRLLFDPQLGLVYSAEECARLFLGGHPSAGALVDERHLYRIELRSRGRGTPVWITTSGLARVGKPELEILEVPEPLTAAALQLTDALAARFISEELPHAGVPFEAGGDVAVALVPASEAAGTVASDVAGSSGDRTRLGPIPRAAICAAGQRGAFRKVWSTPVEALERLVRHDAGLYLSLRVVEVRERLARGTWSAFVAAHAAHGSNATVDFLVNVARGQQGPDPQADTPREHVWLTVDRATADGGVATSVHTGSVGFAVADVGDWRVVGLLDGGESIGPDRVELLR
jgi:hypothetical protein